MKISSNNLANNINFGYNHKLNKELVRKLKENPNSEINQVILQINRSCNDTEDTIRELEKKGIEENRTQINLLAGYLLEAKATLCGIVEKFFPELNFLKKEEQTYLEEAKNRPRVDNKHLIPDRNNDAYLWRRMIAENLSLEELIMKEAEQDEEEPNFEVNSFFNRGPKTKSAVQVDKETSSIEKFIPKSYSPNSLYDIVGLKEAKEGIEDYIIYPLQNPKNAQELKNDYGIELPKFVLFFGPPGCGKTMLAEAVAAQTGCDMYKLELSNVASSYVNGTVSSVVDAIKEVEGHARESEKPVILFMDEMDSLLGKRAGNASKNPEDDKVVNAILPFITEAGEKNIMIIGATNMYNAVDPAVKNRVEYEAYIGLPEKEEIVELLERKLSEINKGKNLASDKESLEIIAQELKEYSPRTINSIIKSASRIAMRRQDEIRIEDFKNALRNDSFEKINEKEYKAQDRSKKIGFTN